MHHHYEAKKLLTEAGIRPRVAFTAYAVIETDPLRKNGKFKKRLYPGHLGNKNKPQWFIIR
ncbi:MAG: hypothetical protein QM504_04110 [Pseudomonadota bacterium]